MDDKAIQRKLNQLTEIANELVDEARKRYGDQAVLFFEAEGQFHLMELDDCEASFKRQEYVRFSSSGYCQMESGAW